MRETGKTKSRVKGFFYLFLSAAVFLTVAEGLAAASVKVTAPNGGEIWPVATSHLISWTQSGLIGSVTIDLYKGTSFYQYLGSAIATTGTFNWVISPIIPTGTDFRVRISQGTVQDFSDYPFSITNGPPVTHQVSFVAGSGGTVVGKTPQTVVHGGSCLPVTASPSTNYHFVNWTGTGGFVPTTSNPLTVASVTTDMTITANFAPDSTMDYTISGTVSFQGSGLANVSMVGLPGDVRTNGSGFYTTKVTIGWGGEVRPTLYGFTFAPETRVYSNVSSDQTGQNYTASSQGGSTHVISGRVTFNGAGLAGVVMTGLTDYIVTNSAGSYLAVVPSGWSGVVVPSLSGYEFSPTSRTYSSVVTDKVNQNYTAFIEGGQSYTVSGKVTYNGGGLAGVLMSGFPGDPLTNTSGEYTAVVSSGWSGTVIPILVGYIFSPGSMTYTSVRSNIQTNYVAENRNPRLTFVATLGGHVEGPAKQEVPYGSSSVPVLAVPDEDSSFLSWTASGGFYSQMNPIVVSGVTRDMVIRANFGEQLQDKKVYFLQPSRGEHVYGAMMVVVESQEGVPVERVEFSLDDRPLASGGDLRESGIADLRLTLAGGRRFMAEWDTREDTYGWHRVKAVAFGSEGTYRDQVLVYVENVILDLMVERREDRGLFLCRQFAHLEFEVSNVGGVSISRYQILRSENGGEYLALRDLTPEQVKDNRYTSEEDNLEGDKRYSYMLVAYDNQGRVVGESSEVDI